TAWKGGFAGYWPTAWRGKATGGPSSAPWDRADSRSAASRPPSAVSRLPWWEQFPPRLRLKGVNAPGDNGASRSGRGGSMEWSVLKIKRKPLLALVSLVLAAALVAAGCSPGGVGKAAGIGLEPEGPGHPV